MKQIFLGIICFGVLNTLAAAETELKSTVAEVRQHLSALERFVNLVDEAEVKIVVQYAVNPR